VTSPNEILEEIDSRLSEPHTLIVGRLINDMIKAFHLTLSDDAEDSFREHCQVARDSIATGEFVPYTAMSELESNQYFIIDDDETLAELSAFRNLANDLLSIPKINPAELDLTIKLYVVAIGNNSNRILFVRRTDPRMNHKGGKFLAFGQEQLKVVEGPVFALSPDFDFILGSNWAVVLKQQSFEVLFREIGLVEQRISTWIKGITDFLPMGLTSIDNLREVALRDSRTWRCLRDIQNRGHLEGVSLEEVAECASSIGLDTNKVIVDEKLVFDPDDRFSFLHLLNEDLYNGPLTGETFESQRKATIG